MDEVIIRRVAEADFPSLGIVAPAAYAAAYQHMWPRAPDLAAHLETFGEAALRDFAAAPGAALWVAEVEGRVLGFLSLLLGSQDPVTGEPGGAEVPRIFLLPNLCNRGVGRALFDAARSAARAAGARYLWLDAMDTAEWACAAYPRWGFTRIGTAVFPKPVAPEFRGMAVFRMELAPSG